MNFHRFIRSRSRNVIAGIFIFLLAFALPALAEDFIAKVYTNATGATLPYRLLEPKNYKAGDSTQYPIVLFFHGAGERGDDNSNQLKHCVGKFALPENEDRFPCFVIAPQCPTNHKWVEMDWSLDSGTRPEQPSEVMESALAILNNAIKEFPVDTNRIYVTGLSMGGFATWDCVTRFPSRFAAAVPICGGGDEKTITPEVARVPIWAFHSIDDRTVKVMRTRNMIAALEKFDGHPHYFEYYGLGHDSWTRAYSESELLPWMFSQRLGQPDTFVIKSKPPEIPEPAYFPAVSAFPGKGPVRTADWFQNLWCDRRLAWWKDREKDKGAVVFLGDSITQGWGSLAKEFPNIKVANRGISGDFTRGLLYRLKADVLDLDPKAIVLLIGTNDLEDGADPETIAENIRVLLAECKAYNPKMPVIVCKVMPSNASKKRPVDKIQKINALVDEIVNTDPQWIRCDTWSIFADENGNAKQSEFPDLLHPNAEGYKKFAAALQPIFDKLNLTR